MGLIALNNTVACEKLPLRESKVKNAFAVMSSAVGTVKDLICLKVLIGNSKIPMGFKVFVSSEAYQTPWGTTTYKLGEMDFILIPENQIILLKVD
jgi:hypothetical protein